MLVTSLPSVIARSLLRFPSSSRRAGEVLLALCLPHRLTYSSNKLDQSGQQSDSNFRASN